MELVADTPAAASVAAPATDTQLHQHLLHGLTPAEQRLASALCTGESLRRYADSRQLSIHTARNQLKSVFSKTGVRSQNELIVYLLRGLWRG